MMRCARRARRTTLAGMALVRTAPSAWTPPQVLNPGEPLALDDTSWITPGLSAWDRW